SPAEIQRSMIHAGTATRSMTVRHRPALVVDALTFSNASMCGPQVGYATTLSSLSGPRMTICSALSGRGRCKTFASSHGARIHTSRSSSVVRITGIAFEWIGSTTAFGDVVRKPRSEEDTSELQSPVPLVWRLFL